MTTDSTVKIRLMTASDYNEVYALWMRCKNMGFNDVDDSYAGISKYLERNPSTCFVAEDARISKSADNKVSHSPQIVGVILTGHDGRRGYIHHMAVDPACRRQGIASRLVDTALTALKAEQISKVVLVAFGYNEAGNAFWERMGFTTRPDLVYRNKALVELKRLDT